MSTTSFEQTDLAICESLQREERDVLESIYPDCVSNTPSGFLKLEISVEFGESRTVGVANDATPSVPICLNLALPSAPVLRASLSTLPPLLLHVTLPPDYPHHSPPTISSLCAVHSWLPQPYIQTLQQDLRDMWQIGDVILYEWVEYLRTAEFLKKLGPASASDADDFICIPHATPHLLISALAQYDTSVKYAKFSQNVYFCSICFTEHKGTRCTQLTCSHIFCHFCLGDFWKLCIVEGDVGRVGCPDPGCVKAHREAIEEEVSRVVAEEDVKRWRWLREKRALEKDPTLVHCPLSFCQTAIPKPSEAGENDGYDKLRTCSRCGFSFCFMCKHSWHGPHVDCMTESIALDYLALPPESRSRALMEQKFGKARLMKRVAKYKEEQANKKWLADSTMACPGCQVHVEKSMGCNHMTCWKCKQHFCFRCGARIAASNPYQHFSDPKLSCHLKLFDDSR